MPLYLAPAPRHEGRGMEAQLHGFLTSALDESGQFHTQIALLLGKSPRAGLDSLRQ
jgi:hypothetical protein